MSIYANTSNLRGEKYFQKRRGGGMIRQEKIHPLHRVFINEITKIYLIKEVADL